MGKSTISMAIFNSYVAVYQRETGVRNPDPTSPGRPEVPRRWAKERSGMTTALVGHTSMAQLEEDLKAMNFTQDAAGIPGRHWYSMVQHDFLCFYGS